jgi:hypothetical protein
MVDPDVKATDLVDCPLHGRGEILFPGNIAGGANDSNRIPNWQKVHIPCGWRGERELQDCFDLGAKLPLLADFKDGKSPDTWFSKGSAAAHHARAYPRTAYRPIAE